MKLPVFATIEDLEVSPEEIKDDASSPTASLPDPDDDDDDDDADDDFEETYGDLEDGHDDLSTPESDRGVDNLE